MKSNMETKKYNWIQASYAKHIPAQAAIAELERIESIFGGLTAENVLKASEPADSLFHKLFTWDDQKAAFNYRLQEARHIINNIEIVVVSDGSTRNIPVFEIVKTQSGNVYKSISDLSTDEISQVRSKAVTALNYWKNKLSTYKEFQKSALKIDEAMSDLSGSKGGE